MIPNPSSDPLRRLHSPLVPEIKAEIGGALKAARLKKGQSLEAVGQQTRISKRYLEALEENRFEEFPALAYLHGFLKSYCDYLELDFEAYWRAIQTDAPAAAPAAKPADASKPAAPPVHRPSPAKTQAPKAAHASTTISSEPHAGDPSAVWRVLVFAVVLAAGVGAILLSGGSTRKRAAQTPPALPSLLQPVHPPAEPHLVVEARQAAWLSASADGRPLFEGKVPRNFRHEWSAHKTITLRTPDPAALQLTLNGRRVPLPAPDAWGAYIIESP